MIRNAVVAGVLGIWLSANAVAQFVPPPSAQQILDRLEEIHLIEDAEQQVSALGEFISILRVQMGTEPPRMSEGSNWRHAVSVDRMLDEVRHVFETTGTRDIPGLGEPPTLQLRWQGGRTLVIVDWHEYLGSEYQAILWRAGREEPEMAFVSLSSDGEQTILSDQPSFIRSIVDVDVVMVRTAPFESDPLTVTFDVSGLRAILQEYDELSAWIP
jgi:hypothetical protein